MSQGRLLAATEEIYDAATGGTPWHVVGTRLKDLVKARSVSLMAGDVLAGQAEILCHAEIPDEAVIAYRRHYRHVDLWTSRAAAVFARTATAGSPPRVLASGELLVPDAEFLRSEFYNDFGRRYGLRYVLGTVAPLGAAGAMPIGLHRPEGADRFGTAEKRLLEAVLPHLRRAMQLRHRLAAAVGQEAPAPGLAVLDALSMGVLVLDADMHVLVANTAAEAMAREAGAGVRLLRVASTRGGAGRTVAAASHRQDHASLQGLVRATALAGEAGGSLRLRKREAVPDIAALVTPLPARLAGVSGDRIGRLEGRALLLLRKLQFGRPAPRAQLLRDLFGLTPTEAEVARALAGGTTKGAVAVSRGLRETTVRTHVRSVLAKTGAANLRDLEGLLSGLEGL